MEYRFSIQCSFFKSNIKLMQLMYDSTIKISHFSTIVLIDAVFHIAT